MRSRAPRLAGRGRRPTSRGVIRDGELDVLDLVRRYGVIVDWATGELHERTTAEFREMLGRRAVAFWPA